MALKDTQYKAIPEPTQDIASILKSLRATIENLEILLGTRRSNVKGVAEQLTDLQSSNQNRDARFSEFIEVTTGNNEALAQRTTTLEAEVADVSTKLTSVEKAYADADKAIGERIDTIEVDVGNNEAKIQSVETAYANADEALAARIDSVEASSGGMSANGQIEFKAVASPAGYTAKYSLYLTAGDVETGMSLLARTLPASQGGDKVSEIVFNASNFRLYDPVEQSSTLPVFAYANNYWTFNIPVRFTDEVFLDKGISGAKLENNAATNRFFQRNESGNEAYVDVIVPADTTVDITADFDGTTQSFPTTVTPAISIYRAPASNLNEETILQFRRLSRFSGTVDGEARFVFLFTGIMAQDEPPAGSYRYKVLVNNAQLYPVTIKVILYKK